MLLVVLGYAVKRMSVKFLIAFLSVSVLAAIPAYAGDVGSWQKAVVKKIGKEYIYPRSAVQREIEGAAKVRVTIDRGGAILNYEVSEPTGENVLDEVIPKIIKKLDPLPAPPSSLPDENLTFVIPFTWRLQ